MEIEVNPGFAAIEKEISCQITQSGIVMTDEAWKQEPLYATFTRLYYVTGGTGMLLSDKKTLSLQPGYVYLAPCGAPCGFYGTPSVSKLFFHVNVTSKGTAGDLFASFDHPMRLPYSVEQIETLIAYYRSDDPRSHFLLQAELARTVGKFLLREGQTRAYSPTVNAAIDYIRTHLRASLTVEEIARAVFCSRSKLSALFRNEVGQTVAHYIDDLLMSEAQTLLVYSDRTVSEIGRILGYCDAFYFSRRFRHRFSISPKEYRKLQRSP